jgi:AcrR family transcriptional regulator
MPATRAPRRLSSEARRRQLAEIAQELIARDGHAGFSLEEVAERADVTRNLLYHYFPRGRIDVFLAAVHLGGEQIAGGWVVDEQVPREERVAANFAHVVEHAQGPSAAWVVYRQARASAEPEVLAAIGDYVDRIVSAVALNQLGTTDPPPLARVALTGFVAFTEVAFDEARAQGIAPEAVMPLLARTLAATMDAVQESSTSAGS